MAALQLQIPGWAATKPLITVSFSLKGPKKGSKSRQLQRNLAACFLDRIFGAIFHLVSSGISNFVRGSVQTTNRVINSSTQLRYLGGPRFPDCATDPPIPTRGLLIPPAPTCSLTIGKLSLEANTVPATRKRPSCSRFLCSSRFVFRHSHRPSYITFSGPIVRSSLLSGSSLLYYYFVLSPFPFRRC